MFPKIGNLAIVVEKYVHFPRNERMLEKINLVVIN